jgi:feruloyl esterase
MTAMIDWVEKGKAPDSIVASRVVNNQVVRTRPLCPYPQVARYSGSGSIDDAANFACVLPQP